MKKAMKDKANVKGFVRFQLVDAESGKPCSRPSKWHRNQVVNLGFQDYICASIGAVAGSKQISHMAIGTGTAPGAAHDSLNGETGARVTTDNSVVSSKTLQMTCQFAGSDMASTCTIQNVGLFNTSSGGTICAGITYATSQWALVNWRPTMVTLFKKLFKVGKYLIETIPSQAKMFLEGVETGWRALLTGVEGTVRTTQQCVEQNRNILPSLNKRVTKNANQNVKYLRSIVVTLLEKLREFGGTLIETIPSRARIFLEGVETMHEAPAFVG